MSYEQITVEDRGLVRVITLDRPDKLNAWTRQMNREMIDAVEGGNRSDAIGAFVFTGAGRAFCAGADISGEFASGATADGLEGRRPADGPDQQDRNWVELVRSSKPMVAAVNGVAVGVGLTMVLPMDRIVAGASARLSARFVRMGLVPELASSHYLVQRCGWGAASDLALSGRMAPAADALAIGLVDEVVDDEVLVETAVATAEGYGANPPLAVRMIKELLTENGAETDLTVVQRRETDRLRDAMRSDEHAEAVAAFLEKREPRFR